MTNIFKSIREAMQVSQSQLADKFHIPVGTIQSWELGTRKPPVYVPEMMIRICELEAMLAAASRDEEGFKAIDDKGVNV